MELEQELLAKLEHQRLNQVMPQSQWRFKAALIGGKREFYRDVIKRFEIDTVYHVAAYKQVPMVENNVVEGVRNNIFGTLRDCSGFAGAGR